MTDDPDAFGGYKFYEVDCCRECNCALGKKLWTLQERKQYIERWLSHRYRYVLEMPVWTSQDLETMSGNFQKRIRSLLMLKLAIRARVMWEPPEVENTGGSLGSDLTVAQTQRRDSWVAKQEGQEAQRQTATVKANAANLKKREQTRQAEGGLLAENQERVLHLRNQKIPMVSAAKILKVPFRALQEYCWQTRIDWKKQPKARKSNTYRMGMTLSSTGQVVRDGARRAARKRRHRQFHMAHGVLDLRCEFCRGINGI